MSIITINADSASLILNGHAFKNFAEGDFIEMKPVNAASEHVNGSGGAVNIIQRIDKDVHDLMVRVQKMSPDDIFLNGALNSDPLTVLAGSLKEDFNRDGTAAKESYTLENGSITEQPTTTKNNTDGNAMMEYTIRFRTAIRNL